MKEKQVVGYSDVIDEKVLKHFNAKIEDFLGATFQIKFGEIVNEAKLKDTSNEMDWYEELVTNNIGKCIKVDVETNIVTVMFNKPLPLAVFEKFYDKTPIFEK